MQALKFFRMLWSITIYSNMYLKIHQELSIYYPGFAHVSLHLIQVSG